MEVISEPVDHGTARTLEAKLIRKRLEDALRDGVIDGTEPIEEQLRLAGLLNRNRGRDPVRWVHDVEPRKLITEPKVTLDITTPENLRNKEEP
jgi:hypothetical protein